MYYQKVHHVIVNVQDNVKHNYDFMLFYYKKILIKINKTCFNEIIDYTYSLMFNIIYN